MPAAPAAGPGVSGDQQRQGVFRSRRCRSRSSGVGTDRRALSAPEEGLLLLPALRVVGGGAVALPQIRLRMTELTLLLPVPGMRLKVRILVALPGILTARLVLGCRGLLQGLSLASLVRVVVRLDLRVWRMFDGSSTFAGFRLACGGLGGVSVVYGLFSSVGKFAGPPRLEVLVRILPPASGRSFIGAPQRGSCCWVDCCLACPRAGVWRSSVRWRVATRVLMVAGFSSPSGVEVGSFSYTLAFSRLTSVLSRCQILAWLVSWGRWLVLGWCLCMA